jgi:hypothetical protein
LARISKKRKGDGAKDVALKTLHVRGKAENSDAEVPPPVAEKKHAAGKK